MTSYSADLLGVPSPTAVRNLVILAQTVLEIYSSEAVGCGIFDRFWNFDDCRAELVSYDISGTTDQDVGVDVYANFGDSRLKPSEAFRPFFERQ